MLRSMSSRNTWSEAAPGRAHSDLGSGRPFAARPGRDGGPCGAFEGLLLSAGSIWELGIKAGLGKLALSLEFKEWIEQALKQLDAAVLPITVEYVDAQRKLPKHHGDPFDRLLVAQAQVEGIPIVSADPVLDKYGTQRIW